MPFSHARFAGLMGLLSFAAACSDGDSSGLAPAPSNSAPSFSSAAAASTAENSPDALYTAAATDADGDTLTYSISGGADAALFSINGTSGAVASLAPLNFEAPTDANTDNVYEITVEVSDGAAAASLAVAITVTDVAVENVSVRRVGSGFSQPLFLAGLTDGTGRVYVVEKGGAILILDPATGTTETTPFLNVASSISTDNERGLLGFALSPAFETDRTFYVNVTNLAGDTEIRRYQTMSGDMERTDLSTEEVILEIPQFASNHNAGWIGFGPDGFLYISSGDGGGSGDPQGNGQDITNLLGAMLRIDVSADDFPGDATRNYAIPVDNPFVGAAGADELWAYGLRNPFRASFDFDTGFLYIGDVGQGAIEEIDLVRPADAGANFGWNELEGTQPFAGTASPAFTAPVAEYPHGVGEREGRSVTGGYVYRGSVDDLIGAYIFGDFISGNVWSLPAASLTQGTTAANTAFEVLNTAFQPNAGDINSIVSFGEDAVKNLYIVDFDGDIFRVETAP